MKFLVVYEEVPEKTRFFAVTNPTEEIEAMLLRVHNQFINSDCCAGCEDDEAKDWLYSVLYDDDGENNRLGEELDSDQPLDITGYDRLVLTGFIL